MSKQKKKKQYYLVSLGCSKNSVDSDSMGVLLNRASYSAVDKPEEAGVLIVNTCGFINSAKKESLEVLRELAENKSGDQLLIAAGCLSQRYGPALVQEIPNLDGVIGTRRWMDIVRFINQLRRRRHPAPLYHLPGDADTVGRDERNVVRASVNGASAFLKIADGCRRPCAFCVIPQIKGTLVSRPPQRIISEVRRLQEAGVKELIIIAQDTSDYGHDLGLKNGLSQLLNQMVEATPDIDWIRIMYTYPGYVTDELIETMANHRQILPYLDMPLQHADRETLKRMRRPANVDWVYKTIEKLRASMPDIALRTTFIVGYPGETDQEFETLVEFVQEVRFDRVGVFPYSYEESTLSANISWHVPDEVKDDRIDRLMQLQQTISLEKNQQFVGKTLPVLIEGYDGGLSLGRSYRDAPEVDGMIIVSDRLPVGEIMPVVIDGALTYDLTGYVPTSNEVETVRMPSDRITISGLTGGDKDIVREG
ncbi:MAG: 30S ribosomal protein S12 methylthiotransferase RimO [Anaerolineae bacterium]|nr:MAG: 30S ribosomal protein S12 methylthiotransferase RimO [Anaerolineae bacterium]